MSEGTQSAIHTFKQFLRFVAVGGITALLYVVFASALASYAELVPWLASTLSYASFALPAYFGHRRFAFRTSAKHQVAMPRYMAVQALCLALSAILTYVIDRAISLPPLMLFTIVACILAIVSFALARLWVFSASDR